MADKNKRGFLERVFRRPSQDTATTKPIENKINAVNTTSTKSIQSIDTLATNEKILMQIYDEMDQDAVISAALDLFADNATLVNKKTGHVAAITSSDAAFQDEINDFLWNIFKIDSEAWHIVRNFIKYGKVFLDTKAVDDGREWSFAIADNPYNIHALVNQANEVKYFAVSPEQEEERNSTSLVFRPPNITQNYELVPANRYLMGLNSRESSGTMTVRTERAFGGEPIDKEYKIRTGRSLLAPVVSTWQLLNIMEQALITNRLTKATQFKIVQVDIQDSTNKEATEIQEALQTAFKAQETIDLSKDKYHKRIAPPTVNDIVIISKRGEKGAISVETVGGEMSEAPMQDIDYMRNKLFAGLGVLKAYLGFEETTPGGLGDSTLTKLDERTGKRVQRVQSVLVELIKDAIKFYWINSRIGRTAHNLPEYTLVMGKISTKEDEEARAAFTEGLQNASAVMSLAQNELFQDKIDPDKLFKLVWEDVIGIDPSKIDTMPSEDQISVAFNKIKRINEQNLYDVTRSSIGRPIYEGRIYESATMDDFAHLLSDTEVILETENYKRYTLSQALNLKRFKDYLTEETYKDLRAISKAKDPQRLSKSKKSVVRYTGIDENNYITFSISAEDPEKNKKEGRPTSYTTKVHLKDLDDLIAKRDEFKTDKELVMKALEGDVAVSCSCPAAKYWGQQYLGTKHGYAIDKNDIPPTVRIPTQPLCKHSLQNLLVLPFYWNTIIKDLRNKGVLPK